MPFRNHWWHVTLSVSTRGISTGVMPYAGISVEVEFDLLDHRLVIRTSDGQTTGFTLRDGLSCATFHRELFAALNEIGVQATIRAVPYDMSDTLAFAQDTEHHSYDRDAVERWWRVMRLTQQALARFASEFNGKSSPTQLFWHTFDLAHARYSGRLAPPIAGADRVTAEAYSHEVIAFGWWPGDARQTPYPAFYSYTSPEPQTLARQPLNAPQAKWQDTGYGSLAILPYDTVRETPNPEDTLLAFYQSAYHAGASTAGWNIEALQTDGR